MVVEGCDSDDDDAVVVIVGDALPSFVVCTISGQYCMTATGLGVSPDW